jgi:pimeloyl-ACP methyl ester carboxylesterase
MSTIARPFSEAESATAAETDSAALSPVPFTASAWPIRAIRLEGHTWPAAAGADNKQPVLMLHGWLDNSLTFVKLAPELTGLADVHAVDLAGHGHSGHRPAGQNYMLMDYVADLAEWVDTYFRDSEESKVTLVGHSLGGIVCSLYAAAFPERVHKLVMIDSIGALSRPVDETIPQLRKAIRKRLAGSGRAVVYPSIAAAAKAREGGLSPLSPEAALTLTPRNMKPAGEGFVWRTDPRLRHPSSLMMTEEQVRAGLQSIEAPTLFLEAEEGLLAKHRAFLEGRCNSVNKLKIVKVPGGHHCHLEGDVRPVADAINRFLTDE